MPSADPSSHPRTECRVRVYYEDTDAGGVVYYANYLRFIERGRTEWLRAIGYDQHRLMADSSVVFAVRSLRAEYLLPARLDDELNVLTALESMGRAQLAFAQSIRCDGAILFEAGVRIACLDSRKMKPAPIPKDILEKIKSWK
ncbi:MAG TPA: tol-pal system-associated acyl-CoA thioesterase [Rhodocyclaceae bacterium]|nr:tol-pal system-associated acyl-CoA thioesterase [Rhodocyclaceae bacterium]